MKLESFLASELEEFLSWWSNMGLRARTPQIYLRQFDRYVLDTGAVWDDFTPRFFLKLQSSVSGGNRNVNLYISAVHKFFKYLVRKELVEALFDFLL